MNPANLDSAQFFTPKQEREVIFRRSILIKTSPSKSNPSTSQTHSPLLNEKRVETGKLHSEDETEQKKKKNRKQKT